MKQKVILLVSILLVASTQATFAVEDYGILDINKPAIYALAECQTDIDLDCIESVSLVKDNNTEVAGKFASRARIQNRIDEHGNFIYMGSTSWNLGNFSAVVSADMESPEHIIMGTVQNPGLRGAALRIQVSVPDPLNTHLKIKFRTSWLRPMSVQLKTMDADFEIKKINGGNLWTIGGSGLKYSDYDGNWMNDPGKSKFESKADVERTFFTFYIHHADTRANYGYWPPVCADKGFTVQSNNTNATGEPSWVGDALQFGIDAPHLRMDGSLNQGYFRFWTTDSFLNCKFPKNTITNSPYLKLEILDDNGIQDVAITKVTHSNGEITLAAAGFHFSSPKIVVKADKSVQSPPSPTPSPIVSQTPTLIPDTSSVISKNSRITITCVKGKQIKKVSGLKPKCPTGFKKK